MKKKQVLRIFTIILAVLLVSNGISWVGLAQNGYPVTNPSASIGAPALGENATISGKVTCPQGHPVSGVYISAFVDIHTWVTFDHTDQYGYYELSLPADSYRIWFYPPWDAMMALTRRDITVNAGQSIVKDISLAPGGLISGNVTDASSAALQNAMISVWGPIVEGFGWGTITDPYGNFTTVGLPPDTYEVWIHPPDGVNLIPIRIPGVEVVADDISFIDISLAEGGILSGTVEDVAGIGVQNAHIFLRNPQTEVSASATTDMSGNFTIIGLPSDTYDMRVNPPQGSMFFPGHRTNISVVAGETTTENIILQKGGIISGTVVDEASNAVPDVSIDIFDSQDQLVDWTSSDQSGDFVTILLHPGTYEVVIRPPDGVNLMPIRITDIEVSAGYDSQIDISLQKGGILSGTVEDVEGIGVQNTFILLWNPQTETGAWATTDVSGNYTIVGLPSDTYELWISPPTGINLAVSFFENFEIVAGTTRDFDVTLENIITINPLVSLTNDPTQTVSGTVYDDTMITLYLNDEYFNIESIEQKWEKEVTLKEGINTITAEAFPLDPYASTVSSTIVLDTVRPTVTFASTAANPTPHTPIQVTASFSEKVSGFKLDDIIVINGAASNLTTADNKLFSFSVTPAARGAVSVDIGANAATDAAGNYNIAAPRFNITYEPPAPPAPPVAAPAPPAPPAPPVLPAVEQPIVKGAATVVQLEGIVEVTVTAGAVEGESPIIRAEILAQAEAEALIEEAVAEGISPVGQVIVLTVTGGEFTAPVQLSFDFDNAKVPAGQVPNVFVYNERTGRWIFLGGQIGNGKITLTVDRFSKFGVFATKPLPELADINEHWAQNTITTMAGMDILEGFPDGTFRPNASVTRAEFTAMLSRALGLELKPEAATKFKDAEELGWAKGAIGAVSDIGLVAGLPDGRFGWQNPITRAEAAVILERVITRRLIPVKFTAIDDFADDADFPSWAKTGILTASQARLVRGFPDNSFRHDGLVTRAEIAVILYRLIAER